MTGTLATLSLSASRLIGNCVMLILHLKRQLSPRLWLRAHRLIFGFYVEATQLTKEKMLIRKSRRNFLLKLHSCTGSGLTSVFLQFIHFRTKTHRIAIGKGPRD